MRPANCPTATAFTGPVWLVNGSPTRMPVAASHTRTDQSSLPEATTVRPSSCPIATVVTASMWPVKGLPTWIPVTVMRHLDGQYAE